MSRSTALPRPSRRGRSRQRGHAIIVVALGSVTFIAVTGLAIDGGMEAAAYRHAQNAADAGALAAARTIYTNAMQNPAQESDAHTLTQVATDEVVHNNAQLAWIGPLTGSTSGGETGMLTDGSGIGYSYRLASASGTTTGAPAATTSSQTAWIPTGGGLTGSTALGELQGIAGTVLSPVDATLDLAGTQATATAIAPSGGGSVASSQVDMGATTASSSGITTSGYMNCWTARATYTAGSDTVGTTTACPVAGSVATGVSATGTFLGGYGTHARVDRFDAPTALPRMMALNPAGAVGSSSLSATQSGSSTSLYWDALTGLTSAAGISGSNVHATMTSALTVSTAAMVMRVRVYVDSTGTPKFSMQCTPTTLSLVNVVNNVSITAHVDSSCASSDISSLGMANVTTGWTSPSSATSSNVCSTSNGGLTVSCSVQACFLRAVITASPFNSVLCLGEANVTLNGVAVTNPCTGSCNNCTSSSPCTCTASCSTAGTNLTETPNTLFSQFTGAVSVAATVPQSTYFLRVLGWNQTKPTAAATADIESVVDQPDAAFAASPYGMPDMATTSTSCPCTYEHLQLGHTYYLYGSNMQSLSPSTAMPQSWQGQLSSTSPHRVGTWAVGSTSTGTPQEFLGNQYYLEPVFDPVTGAIEYYGIFTPTTVNGDPNYGTFTNYINATRNGVTTKQYVLVQSTSVQGWVTMQEGAAAVKLEQ